MGLFSFFESEEITRVATTVSRVIDDKAMPKSVQSGAIKALFNDGNLPDYVMEELVGSIGVRAERMYRYAEEKYTFGLPSGDVYSSTQGRAQVEQTIETIEGKQVSIEYSHFGAPNALHIGWTKLIAEHGYDYATNKLNVLSAAKGTPVYLDDMVVVVPSARAATLSKSVTEQWGAAARGGYTPERPNNLGDIRNMIYPSPIVVSTTAPDVQLRVSCIWKVGALLSRETFTISISEYVLTDGYFHAKYYVDGVAKFWMYENDSGVYSLLDAVFVDAPAESGSYFPFTYFRYGKSSTISNTTTEAYKTSKKMAQYLGMDYDLVGAAIDENPNIADVEQALMIMAVPPVSNNDVENRYLFDYFDNMHNALGGNTSASALHLVGDDSSDDQTFSGIASRFLRRSLLRSTRVIQDKRFKMALGNNGSYKRLVGGSIGPIGTYKSNLGTSYIQDVSYDEESGQEFTSSTPLKVHRYRHQVSANYYEEILVLDLRMTYYIWGGYTTSGSDSSSLLLIPIDKSVSQNYSIADRETLYSRSLHFVFNSRTVTEVKWYQQEWFQAFVIVVAVVITVASYGADGGSAIATALGLTGTAGLIATVVVTLAIGALMPKIFGLFVKVFGQDVATLIAVAALIYGSYQLSVNGVAGAPMAKDMLMLSSGLSDAVIKDKFNDLLAESEQFKFYAETQEEILEKANELLENSTVLSPFVIYGEKPEEFYNRTIHFGNIGTLGINAISSYVDIALTLPKLNDTLGEPLNE